MTARRIGASLFDFIVLLGLITFLPNFIVNTEVALVVKPGLLLQFFLLCVLHSFIFMFAMGATPGKLVFGLRVVQADLRKMNIKQAFLRSFLSIAGAWILGPGLKASAFLNSQRRHWYDILLGTKVILRKGETPSAPIRKHLAWAIIICVTLFFIVNHIQSMQNMSFEGGDIIYRRM